MMDWKPLNPTAGCHEQSSISYVFICSLNCVVLRFAVDKKRKSASCVPFEIIWDKIVIKDTDRWSMLTIFIAHCPIISRGASLLANEVCRFDTKLIVVNRQEI